MSEIRNSRTFRTVSINDLKPFKDNPLSFSKKSLRKHEALVREHGQIPAIQVTTDLTIVAGEEWWLALKNAGETQVLVQVLADLSPAEATTAGLALGRLPLDADLNTDRLRAVLLDLQVQGIDLDLTGYDQPQIDFSLEIDTPPANVAPDFDAIPSRQNHAISKLGDTYRLDAHQLACGDARDQALVDRLRAGRQANVCITDFTKFSDSGLGNNRFWQRDLVEARAERSDAEFAALVSEVLAVLRCASAPAALIYAFIDWRHIFEFTAAARYLELPVLDIAVWAKPSGGLGGLYRSAHELCAIFKAGRDPHTNNVLLGKRGRNRKNVWHHAPPASKADELGAHPSVKPVAMLADILRDCTKRGDLVIDTFLGSGSTLMAAEQTGRTCIGTELNPHEVDITIRRWQAITGHHAIHLGTGRRFDDIAQNLLICQEG